MIMVSGIPRSGTSWISRVLGYSDSTAYYYEPDNEHNNLMAYVYKQHLHRFPYLTEHDDKNGLYTIFRNTINGRYMQDYSKLSTLIKTVLGINLNSTELEVIKKCNHLDRARGSRLKQGLGRKLKVNIGKMLYFLFRRFESHNWNNRLPLIKTVHSALALPYLQSHFNPRMLVVLRHPASIIASHLRLDNPDIYRNVSIQEKLVRDYLQAYIKDLKALKHPLEKAGAQIAVFYHVLGKQLRVNADWIKIHHEDFCRDPLGEFKQMYDKLGLNWSNDISEKVSALDVRGESYTPQRLAKRQINKWRRELNTRQVEKIRRGYGIIKPTFYNHFV